jgi:hypothetical protein
MLAYLEHLDLTDTQPSEVDRSGQLLSVKLRVTQGAHVTIAPCVHLNEGTASAHEFGSDPEAHE